MEMAMLLGMAGYRYASIPLMGARDFNIPSGLRDLPESILALLASEHTAKDGGLPRWRQYYTASR